MSVGKVGLEKVVWHPTNSIMAEFLEEYAVINCVKSFLKVKEYSTGIVAFIQCFIDLVSDFHQCMGSTMLFSKTKLITVEAVKRFQKVIDSGVKCFFKNFIDIREK